MTDATPKRVWYGYKDGVQIAVLTDPEAASNWLWWRLGEYDGHVYGLKAVRFGE